MNILITGASRGIGRAVAIEFAKNKHNIIICAKSDLEGLKNTKQLVENEGVSCYTGLCDVTNEDSVKDFISDSVKIIGQTDILINNAGISYIGLLQDMSLEDWNKVLSTNLTSAFLMSKYVIPEMLKKQSGHIINISSVWGNIGASMEVAYSASKGGINSFTKALAKELAPSNISVNAISPGFIDTDMNKVFEKDELDAIFEEIPMGRAGSPSEVAKLIYKIAMSDYITGQIITIDGGWT
ncbi:elongation factor P 5-aminopentanone reductase [Lachnoanaerobaculum orale]|uniref:elongation factor P 5-aminopentanone reductase n=1 Tax=Lachnoanaerobaculum orale TaxID=979627 RepID=UPI0023A7D2EF|nr:3-oxoacyl-ACP reductase FabG [Lachnoanaerobaculum orale]